MNQPGVEPTEGGTEVGDTQSGTGETAASTASETGDPTEGADWRRICDGSSDVKLTLRSVGGGIVATAIARELGTEFLYVRGDCRYWVAEPLSSGLTDWRITRTGVLSGEQEEELSRDLLYDRWSDLAGLYLGPGNPEGYEIQYSDGTSTIRCELACASDVDAPQALKDLTPVARDWFMRLWQAGEPLGATEPMRVDILRIEGSEPLTDNPCALEWPLALDPKPLSRGPDDGLPPSRLIDEQAAAGQLRALREQYLADELPPGTCNLPLENSPFLFFEKDAPAVALSLWMRDAVAIEQAEGGVPIPDAP